MTGENGRPFGGNPPNRFGEGDVAPGDAELREIFRRAAPAGGPTDIEAILREAGRRRVETGRRRPWWKLAAAAALCLTTAAALGAAAGHREARRELEDARARLVAQYESRLHRSEAEVDARLRQLQVAAEDRLVEVVVALEETRRDLVSLQQQETKRLANLLRGDYHARLVRVEGQIDRLAAALSRGRMAAGGIVAMSASETEER